MLALSGTEDSGKCKTSTLARASRRKCDTSNSRLLGIAKAMALSIQSTINLRKEKECLASRDNDDEVWLVGGLEDLGIQVSLEDGT